MSFSGVTKLVAVLLLSGVVVSGLQFADHLQSSESRDASLAALLELEMELVQEWRSKGGLRSYLKHGSSGPEVKLLQQTLARVEGGRFSADLTTGYYGPITRTAVASWQAQHDLPPVGVVGPRTRALVNQLYFSELCPEQRMTQPDRSLEPISKERGVPIQYIPKNLVDITDRVRSQGPVCMEAKAAAHLEEMFAAAAADGIELAASSGFRRYEIQDIIHQHWTEEMGEEALDISAEPGHSEHQLGTVVDLTGRSIDWKPVTEDFAGTPEDRWLQDNAYRFGFVLSYGEDKQDVTGYAYEPWHYRYITPQHAKAVHLSGATVKEYLEQVEGGE